MRLCLGLFLSAVRRATGGPPVSPGDALLLESGDYLLLENGDKLLLEA